jgi:hypothetical protein
MGRRLNKKVSMVPVIIPVWLKDEMKKESSPVVARIPPQSSISFEE